jgi:hypothetical protein
LCEYALFLISLCVQVKIIIIARTAMLTTISKRNVLEAQIRMIFHKCRFSWAQKRQHAFFFPGELILFFDEIPHSVQLISNAARLRIRVGAQSI